jgi:hypothetical protein
VVNTLQTVVVVVVVVVVVTVLKGRICYFSTCSVYIKFVGCVVKVSHRCHVCNY